MVLLVVVVVVVVALVVVLVLEVVLELVLLETMPRHRLFFAGRLRCGKRDLGRASWNAGASDCQAREHRFQQLRLACEQSKPEMALPPF